MSGNVNVPYLGKTFDNGRGRYYTQEYKKIESVWTNTNTLHGENLGEISLERMKNA